MSDYVHHSFSNSYEFLLEDGRVWVVERVFLALAFGNKKMFTIFGWEWFIVLGAVMDAVVHTSLKNFTTHGPDLQYSMEL